MENVRDRLNQLTESIIQAAIKVHRALGPGLLDSAYRECLTYELRKRGYHVDVDLELPLMYDELQIKRAYRIDLLISGSVVVEVKSIERFEGMHRAQMLTYLRLSKCTVGLMLNFNKETLVAGLKRVVSECPESDPPTAMAVIL